ncbi:hypothetical protein BDR03DRAFT_959083 [Suillus americanus]|nr:hypothetical protein BDR03DRAFT_959083 [Suillus americanus]
MVLRLSVVSNVYPLVIISCGKRTSNYLPVSGGKVISAHAVLLPSLNEINTQEVLRADPCISSSWAK